MDRCRNGYPEQKFTRKVNILSLRIYRKILRWKFAV